MRSCNRYEEREGISIVERRERRGAQVLILEQLRKGYIRPSKLPQTALVFFVGKKDRKKKMVQNY